MPYHIKNLCRYIKLVVPVCLLFSATINNTAQARQHRERVNLNTFAKRVLQVHAPFSGSSNKLLYSLPPLFAGKQPPCGAAANLEDDTTFRWPVDKLPVKVFISSGDGITGYRPSFKSCLINSFNVWSDSTGDKLSWQLVDTQSEADIVCTWTSSLPVIAAGAEAGRTRVFTRINTQTKEGIIIRATMDLLTINDDGRPFRQTEMLRICLHEAGHALGIENHSPYHDDIMYEAVSASQPAHLSAHDKATIVQLYKSYPAPTEISTMHVGTSAPHS